MEQSVYSVSQVNLYIRNMFERERILSQIYVKGEVSNCKYHSSGHIYFTLKDEKGQMACVMFAGQRSGLSFRMSEGQSVIVLGSISVYERDGKYQLYARQIMLDGQGVLYERFEQLKEKLKEQGLFDAKYKQPIKKYNKTVGIVTASTGAAIQDIRNITHRRNPFTQLVLYPAKVQGEGAAATIVKGIEILDAMNLDVIIVGRGGGSIEDLWAFNEEEVAWAIFNCNTPVISAVGHETDTTIADYVADLRAPTPSAGAELAVFDLAEWMSLLSGCQYQLNQQMNQKIRFIKSELMQKKLRLSQKEPMYQLRQKQQHLIDQEERLEHLMLLKIKEKRHQLEVYAERMKGVSPLNRLSQGYSYVETEDGTGIRSIEDVKKGDLLHIELKDGSIEARVEKRTKRKRKC